MGLDKLWRAALKPPLCESARQMADFEYVTQSFLAHYHCSCFLIPPFSSTIDLRVAWKKDQLYGGYIKRTHKPARADIAEPNMSIHGVPLWQYHKLKQMTMWSKCNDLYTYFTLWRHMCKIMVFFGHVGSSSET